MAVWIYICICRAPRAAPAWGLGGGTGAAFPYLFIILSLFIPPALRCSVSDGASAVQPLAQTAFNFGSSGSVSMHHVNDLISELEGKMA